MGATSEDDRFRLAIGEAFRVAREALGYSVHRAGDSGIGYRVIGRLETGRNEQIELSTCYLLAMYYGIDLREVLRARPEPTWAQLGRWPPMPSVVETDRLVRARFRDQRNAVGVGQIETARRAQVHQSWLALWEIGRVSRSDLVRLRRCAAAVDTLLPDLLPPPLRRAARASEATC